MQEITLKVSCAELLLTDGMDELFLHLEGLDSPFPYLGGTQATMQINISHAHGLAWTKKNLNIEPKIVDLRRPITPEP